ncbi:hypothetical protein M426DRAFT_183262 [Hypoxylon sp. CI-4A]|nr:hypothetical protein M426DRAFT_183262 [Hypoxylon sp. CI-4A]
MDRPTLQTPKPGRSRFSKALPAPPPELEVDRPKTATRGLPSLPRSPFPPRKDSVSVKTSPSLSPPVMSSIVTSPLPALPRKNIAAAAPSQPQSKMIPRKPVGLPANPAPTKSKKMKRVSSISSLLSAYSYTSSDSVQRSSQGSVFTKDSEPSNSPEREGMNDGQQSLVKTLPELPSNPYGDEVLRVETIIAELPPPPPLKDLTRPSTPPSARPLDSSSAPRSGAQDEGVLTSSPTIDSDSPGRKEIWRRRAVQGLGLPRFPRPAQSSPTLRSVSSSQNVPETLRPGGPQQPQPIPSPAMPIPLPTDASEPMKKPELFNVVTALNEPNISSDLAGNRRPTRKISRDVGATGLSDIGESAENMTPEQIEKVNEALSRFPRNFEQLVSPADTVWKAPPVSSRHYNCYVRHAKWVPVKNSNYPLACQTCHAEDASSRKTCSWCNLRVCFKCHERLMGPYKGSLQTLMEKMEIDQLEDNRRSKGKQAEVA